MRPTLRLLGGAAIDIDGVVVSGPAAQRHRLGLLALLATSPHRTLSRDKLAAALWPDHGQDEARRLLRQAVYTIRKELGEDVLRSAGEQITLDPGRLPSDLHDFERALGDGDLARAVDLYGGPFLDGFHLPGSEEFERWSDGERLRLAGAYGESLKSLAGKAAAAGDFHQASRWWERLTAHDPYDSGAALGLVQALAAIGDRGGALRHAEQHARFLKRELDVPPDPRVAAFAGRLRSATLEAGPPGSGTAVLEPAGAGGAAPSPARPAGVGVDGARSRPSARGRWLWAGIAAMALLTVPVLRLAFRDSAAPISEDRIAVLPFEVRGGERFAYLREGLVDLLSSKVEGAGRLQSVDARALLSFVRRQGGARSSLDVGRAAAREFGAGLFVAGSVVAAGDRLEIHAALYDAAGERRASLAPVTGGEDQLFAMVDRLARSLVASRYEAEGERLSSLAATTTRSISALRSYLAGEAAFRAGRFDQAVEAFRRATARDTTFALAWYRLAVAEEWSLDLEAAQRAVSRAVRHGARLAERDRLLLDAWQAYFSGRPADAERLYRRIREAHPEDVEAWFQLAEVQFHYGPARGRSIAESRSAFERVLALEPHHEGAFLHLARIAARAGRATEIGALSAELRRLSPVSELGIEMRILAAFAEPDPAARDAVAAELSTLDDAAVFTAIWTASYANPVVGIERLAPILTETVRPADVRATGHLLLATAALAQGRLEDAGRELDLAALEDRDRALPYRALFATLPFIDTPVEEVERLREELRAWDVESIPAGLGTTIFLTVHDGIQPQLEAYLTSLLADAAGADDEAPAAVRRLEQIEASDQGRRLARNLALGARAEILQRTDPLEALAALEGIQREVSYLRVVASPFFALSRERFLRAELLRSTGRTDRALRLYRSFLDASLFDLPYLAPAHLARAQIHDRGGAPEEALRHYRRFIALWRDADPGLRPRVDQARQRVAALMGREEGHRSQTDRADGSP